ncbi:MAG: ATP-grasp domain-containing protein [Succinivibrio sp.]|nr:ATP-grasp domain-containing protein [Succinivibrio sp.]
MAGAPKKVLIYPCGTEIALEILKATRYSRFYTLYGGSCSRDHGRFAFARHLDKLPFIRDGDPEEAVRQFNERIRPYKFDFIYPAMDGVLTVFARYRHCLDPVVIAPPYETAAITRSKLKTYQTFRDLLPLPEIFATAAEVTKFPVFLKPAVGQGAVGTLKVDDAESLRLNQQDGDGRLILEYLPGREYTIDCFTNARGRLIYCKGRSRDRIKNGISVSTAPCERSEFKRYAEIINSTLTQRGGWFFQMREDSQGELKLLEIASRIAGSSALHRALGVNLPLLTLDIFNGVEIDSLALNDCEPELDRALHNSYRLNLEYESVYVDFDDTLVLHGQVNVELLAFLYQCLNRGKKLILLSRHEGPLAEELQKYRLLGLFDEVIQIPHDAAKADCIKHGAGAIFIDDSYGERKAVQEALHIPVFDPAMIEALMMP